MLFTHGRVYRHSQIYTDSGVCFALKADGTHFSQMAEFVVTVSSEVPVRAAWENLLLSCESQQFWQLQWHTACFYTGLMIVQRNEAQSQNENILWDFETIPKRQLVQLACAIMCASSSKTKLQCNLI